MTPQGRLTIIPTPSTTPTTTIVIINIILIAVDV